MKKSILILILVLVLALAFSACSADQAPAAESDEPDIAATTSEEPASTEPETSAADQNDLPDLLAELRTDAEYSGKAGDMPFSMDPDFLELAD